MVNAAGRHRRDASCHPRGERRRVVTVGPA
jgi:hypothetical protein